MKKILALISATVLPAASIALAPAADAATIQVCVKKSTGSVKMITKKNKKCKKGWVKKTWSSQGPTGPAGPQGVPGPNWLVKDKNGVTLGTFSGYYTNGLVGSVLVTAADGGVFRYRMDGQLINDNGDLLFLNNGCTEAVVRENLSATLQPYLNAAGGNGRAVFQVTGAPAATAYKVAATTVSTVPIGANMLFEKSEATGACAAATHAAGFYVPLAAADAPVVAATGALQVVR